jgi:long-subunit acyl-CoA synthetase (AMP-forming)
MSAVLSAINEAARNSPGRIALVGNGVALSFKDLESELSRQCRRLLASRPRAIGLLMDNSPAWAIVDLAAQKAQLPVIPLPAFFSSRQLLHTLRDAGIDTVFTDAPTAFDEVLDRGGIAVKSERLETIGTCSAHILSIDVTARSRLHSGVAKISYTSGTTGEPKGVCLRQAAIDNVARSLTARAALRPDDRHLSLLPLSTLLENIGGIYAPLLAGATCCLPSLHALGTYGAARIDVPRMLAALQTWRPTTAIMVPQMLQGLVEAVEDGMCAPAGLRFLAVGGAPVSQRLLRRANACGLPVYEGYGLSECASVVAVNGSDQQRIGSVGKPLSHIKLRFADDGEILVAGAVFDSYLGDRPEPRERFLATGDLGHLDGDGYLHITGRKKHMFVTSFGRNVAPEWIERELTLHPAIKQAAVFGEGRPWNTAVVVPTGTPTTNFLAAMVSAIAETNKVLPDYARVAHWIVADAPFSVANGQLTATGRIRRETVWHYYSTRIEQLYLAAPKELSA